jgi:hypothetical protein
MPAAGASKVLHLPGFCPQCRRIFPAVPVPTGGRLTIIMQSSRTNCPTCGESAEILDGTYTAVGERLNAFLAPSISDAARAAVVELVKQVQAGEKSVDEARREAKALHPRLGMLFDHWSADVAATLLLVAATLAAPRLSPPPQVDVHVEMLVSPPPEVRAPPSPQHRGRPELKKRLLSGTALTTPPPKPKR